MDRNLHTDDFVRLLREKSDEFRMYPSKRIWFSIYNNIHPCRKWPSVAMSIALITALLLVGYLNTNNATSSLAKEKNSQLHSQNTHSLFVYQPFPEYTGTNESNQTRGEDKGGVQNQLSRRSLKATNHSELFAKQQSGVLKSSYSADAEMNRAANIGIGKLGSINTETNTGSVSGDGQQGAAINESGISVYQSDPVSLLKVQSISPVIIANSQSYIAEK